MLELGYGDGRFTRELLNHGYRVSIVEGPSALVEKAKQTFGGQVECFESLFEEFKPLKKFDRILATFILEHLDEPIEILKRVRKWLKPRGKLIILVPNAESIHRQLAVIMGLQPKLHTLSARDHLVGHQRVYTLKMLSGHLSKAGFKVREEKGFFLTVLPNSMMLNYSKELLIGLNEISDQLPHYLLANIGTLAEPKVRK